MSSKEIKLRFQLGFAFFFFLGGGYPNQILLRLSLGKVKKENMC